MFCAITGGANFSARTLAFRNPEHDDAMIAATSGANWHPLRRNFRKFWTQAWVTRPNTRTEIVCEWFLRSLKMNFKSCVMAVKISERYDFDLMLACWRCVREVHYGFRVRPIRKNCEKMMAVAMTLPTGGNPPRTGGQSKPPSYLLRNNGSNMGDSNLDPSTVRWWLSKYKTLPSRTTS